MKKLLIVSNTFFPDPAVSAVRMSQWAKHLPEFGWETVICCRNHGKAATEQELSENISTDCKVVYLNSSPSARLPDKSESRNTRKHRLNSLIGEILHRLPLFIPDLSIRYWSKTFSTIDRIVTAEKPDVILTTSPSHAVHSVGLYLSKRFPHIPWVADFRDPYMIDDRFRPKGLAKVRLKAHLKFEESIYRDSAGVIHAIRAQNIYALAKWPEYREKIQFVPNGFPLQLLTSLSEEMQPRSKNNRIGISVIGQRGEKELLVFAKAIHNLNSSGFSLELRVAGRKSECFPEIGSIMGDDFKYLGFISHREAIEELSSSEILLNLLSVERSKSWALSSKLFEYLATGKSVISANPTRSDQDFTRQYDWVRNIRNPDVKEAEDILKDVLANLTTFGQNRSYLSKFNRRVQTERVASILSDLIQSESPVV
jgi:glycosyltransferase involved in cell wall biosynthesis